jgi:hypothetical protein
VSILVHLRTGNFGAFGRNTSRVTPVAIGRYPPGPRAVPVRAFGKRRATGKPSPNVCSRNGPRTRRIPEILHPK